MHVALLGDDERVDLEQRAVEVDERLVERRQELRRRLVLVAAAGRGRRRARAPATGGSRPPDRPPAFRIFSGCLAATSSISMPPSVEAITVTRPDAAIDDHADVELAGDVDALLDEEALDLLALGAGLVRDELHAEDGARLALRVDEALGDLDAAALAAAAGVDLRLDDDDVAPGLLLHPARRRRRPRRGRGRRGRPGRARRSA